MSGNKTLKKTLSVLCACIVCLSAAACQSTDPASGTSETAFSAQEPSETVSAISPDAIPVSDIADLKNALDNAKGPEDPTEICLTSDIFQSAVKSEEILTVKEGTSVILESSGDDSGFFSLTQNETQTAAGTGVLIVKGSLTLKDITIDAGGCGRGIFITETGTVILDSGAVVTGGTTTSKNVNAGLGVYVTGATATGDAFGTLIINEGASIRGNSHQVSTYGRALGIGVYAGGHVEMNGGSITENTDTTEPTSSEPRAAGGGVYTKSNAGSADSPWATSGAKNFVMNGGEISGNTAFAGGGIFCGDYSLIELNSGSICDNTAVYAGGGLASDGNSGNTDKMVKMSVDIGPDVTFSGNTAGAGGAVYAGSGRFSINGSRFISNTAFTDEDSPRPASTICPFASSGGSGGAIFMAQAEVSLTDADMTGNSASSDVKDAEFPVGNGGAIYVTNAANYIYTCLLTLNGCSLTGNTASGSGSYAGMGGGICIGFEPGDDESFVPEVAIDGSDITGNSASGTGADIMICTELSYKTRGYGGHDYGVGTQIGSPAVYISDTAKIGSIYPSDYEMSLPSNEDTSDETAAHDEEEDGFLASSEITIPENAVHVNSTDSLEKALETGADFIVLDSDMDISSSIEISSDLTICGNSHSLCYKGESGSEGMVRAEEGIIKLYNLRLDSGTAARTLHISEKADVLVSSCVLSGRTLISRGLSVYNEGTLTLTSSLITKAASASVTYEGVIYNTGTLNFSEGSVISDDSYVYTGTVFNDGIFNMTGGSITGTGSNSNRKKFGAAVTNNGTFNMTGGIISGCTNSEAVFSSGTFNMSGGAITENISTCLSGMTYNSVLSGGGVLIYGGTFTMTDDAEISFNTGYMGAGVGVYYSGSVFNMYGGIIRDNLAGIDPQESTFNDNNGCGGGVGVYGGAEFNMYGGTISGNTAYIGDMAETSRMSGSYTSFDGTGLGGGIYITEGSVNITGGSVTGNSALFAPYSSEGGRGGGIYIADSSYGSARVTITGGTITGNYSDNGYGSDIYSGYKEVPVSDLICLNTGGDALLGDICLAGNRTMLGICETINTMTISALSSEGRTSIGASIVRYLGSAVPGENDSASISFEGVSGLRRSQDGTELVIDLLDLSGVTDIRVADMTYTGKEIDTSGLDATLTIADRWTLDVPGLSGLRVENARDITDAGIATIDLRGDNIRYKGELKDVHFNILPMPLDSDGLTVEFSDPEAVYVADGSTFFEPEIRISLDSKSSNEEAFYLSNGPSGDYIVSYDNNRDAGTGYIYITATDIPESNFTGERTVTFEIFEPAHAEEIKLSADTLRLPAGTGENSSAAIFADIFPEGAKNTGIIWSSSDDSVACVDQNGFVTAVSYGNARITALADDGSNVSASCTVECLFSDVAGSNVSTSDDYQYYYDPVYWAVENGITSGLGSVFGVGEKCSKGEFLIMLMNMFADDKSGNYKDPSEVFSDMKDADKDSELYQAAAWGYSEKIVTGSEQENERLLQPEAWLSRADMAVMLWRAAGRPRVSGKMKFTDVTESGYAKNSDLYRAVLWITKKNIAKGYKQDDGSSIFGLTRGCYREYAVTYLYRVNELSDQ